MIMLVSRNRFYIYFRLCLFNWGILATDSSRIPAYIVTSGAVSRQGLQYELPVALIRVGVAVRSVCC